ncbi:Cupredoxin [Polychytrium aggregatum]|uniref:Cupredoxin n=1 Tax=Polychytrium aggregatum TaxID=110093 RepID=UPI0022FE865A|nr:Cupredoxin [Polychytrium aggregatum]KAI9202143.1 Cupredoxin [Polychytrium aggregatum]
MAKASILGVWLLLATLAFVARAANVTVNWDITYVYNVNPDGLAARWVIGVNGSWPIPAINVTEGDLLILSVKNSLNVSTSLHTHGMFQNGTGYYDGVPGVVQCPIQPGQSFTYRIPMQQHGTYWIHAHYKGQYGDGLRTALTIKPQTPEYYQYDQEYTVVLSDWYHTPHDDLMVKFMSPYNPTGSEPIPDSALINDNSDNSTFAITAGKTYRFRLINVSLMPSMFISIDGHNMTIIEVDGIDVQPYTVQSLPITTAQRYSILVTALNTTTQNFQFHADIDPSMLDFPDKCTKPNATATLIYNATAPTAVMDRVPWNMTFNDMELVPVVPVAAVDPDTSFELNVIINVFDDASNHATFNNIVYAAPPVTPALWTALTMGPQATDPTVYGQNSHPLVLQHNQMVQVVINNLDSKGHPFHLHGHVFQVVFRSTEAGQYYNSSIVIPPQPNPVRRDTVIVPGTGSAVLRFRADNPGIWLFHCHIEWHLEAGLAATFIEAPLEIQSRIAVPQELSNFCTNNGFKTSGNAMGNNGTDLTGYQLTAQPLSGNFETKGIISLVVTIVVALLGLGTVVWFGHHQ